MSQVQIPKAVLRLLKHATSEMFGMERRGGVQILGYQTEDSPGWIRNETTEWKLGFIDYCMLFQCFCSFLCVSCRFVNYTARLTW